jgi:hypothetical protein
MPSFGYDRQNASGVRIDYDYGAVIRTERLDGRPSNGQIFAVDVIPNRGIRERRFEPRSACYVCRWDQ